jgi:hypothetical protein
VAKGKKADQLEAKKKADIIVDRRSDERRKQNLAVTVERRKVPRRRQIDPTTCERDYTDEEVEFMQALDAYKRRSGRMFPTCSEILEVIRDMGYVRVAKDATVASNSPIAETETVSAT